MLFATEAFFTPTNHNNEQSTTFDLFNYQANTLHPPTVVVRQLHPDIGKTWTELRDLQTCMKLVRFNQQFKPCSELKHSDHSTFEQKPSQCRLQTHTGRTLDHDTQTQGDTRPRVARKYNINTTFIDFLAEQTGQVRHIEAMEILFSDLDLTVIFELQWNIKIILLGLEQLDGLL